MQRNGNTAESTPEKYTLGEDYQAFMVTCAYAEVACITIDFCFKTDVIVAAILHDVVEESACTVALVAQEFNPRIAQIVDRLTRLPYGSDNPETKLSIEAIMTNLKQLDDKEAMLIKEIDRLHNLATAQGLEQGKQSKMVTETFKSIIPHCKSILFKLTHSF